MRRRLLPSTSALMAFEAAMRQGSIVQAAAELHLSQSAVSRLVKQVEDALGVRLFDRVRQRLVLTEAGRAYGVHVRKMLQELEDATSRTMSYGAARGVISLGIFSTFATKWLLPRLPDFHHKNPGIIVNCFVRNSPFDFNADTLDAAIHYGEPVWPGTISAPLFRETVVPVMSPALANKHVITSPEDFVGVPLLHEVTRPTAWRDWFWHHGIKWPAASQSAWFDQFGLIAAAACGGLGAGLVPQFLIEDELRDGRLVIAIDAPSPRSEQYFLVYPHRNAGSTIVETFQRWIAGQVLITPSSLPFSGNEPL